MLNNATALRDEEKAKLNELHKESQAIANKYMELIDELTRSEGEKEENQRNIIDNLSKLTDIKANLSAYIAKRETLLENINLDELAAELRAKMIEKGAKSDKQLLKRIEIVESFRASSNKCSWMILDVIPVIPPELRPMVQLDGGRFATSDLNVPKRFICKSKIRLGVLE